MNAITNLLTENKNQCSFANITTITNPCKPSKKTTQAILDLGHKEIKKISSRNVSIGNKYQNAVQNRLEKNNVPRETFQAQPRPWATRITQGLIQHTENKQLYIEYYYLNANKSTSKYIWEDGTELTKDEFQFAKINLFKSHSTSKKQEDAGLTEDQQVKLNIVKMENVISIQAFGKYVYNTQIDKSQYTETDK